MLDALAVEPGDRILDPSCGDGSFLRGAVAALRRRFPHVDGATLARHWRERIIGFDIDETAVADARRGLQAAFREHCEVEIPEEQLQVYHANPLDYPRREDLLQTMGLSNECRRLLLVGNPPYVEAKRLSAETKRDLKERYPDACSGAPDLYLYFLHLCLGWLGHDDQLAFVLPNKLLVNTNARRLRQRLLHEHRLRRLWLATETRLFTAAGVYPIVLFAGGAAAEPCEVEVVRMERSAEGGLSAGDPIPVAPALYAQTASNAFYAPPAAPVLREALETLLVGIARAPLDDVLDLRWTVSFHRAGLREHYVTPVAPNSPTARRFLGGGAFSGNGEVTRYGVRWGGWWIDYDEERLRREGNCLPPLALFERPKIVICQNGRTLRAAYDDEQFVLKDTLLCGVLREVDHPLRRHPRALVGLLCSAAVHFFYSHVFYGGHVSGGYLHFLRSFLVDVPLGEWTEARAAATESLVVERESAPTETAALLEERIEEEVAAALGLTPEQHEAIRRWTAEDRNWRARERVRGPVSA